MPIRHWTHKKKTPACFALCPLAEARRGHGPHGASRRRDRIPAERVRARPEADLVINRGRGGMVNAGAVSEGRAPYKGKLLKCVYSACVLDTMI